LFCSVNVEIVACVLGQDNMLLAAVNTTSK